MTSLFCLTEERIRLLREVEDKDGELDAYLDQYLADNQLALEAKVENYVCVIREFEGRANARKVEADRLLEIARVDLAARDRMKARLLECLQAMGLKKVGRVTVAGNGGKQPLRVTEEDATRLPPEFQLVLYQADNDAMRAALEAGREDVPARLEPRGVHLSIK